MNAPPDKIPTNPHLSRASIAPGAAAGAATRPAPAQAAPVNEAAPDVGAMIRRIFAHAWVVLITLMIGGIVTAQVVRTRKAYYKSETVLSYREGIGASVTGSNSGLDVLKVLGTRLKEQLIAQQNLRRVIEEFHLYPELVSKGLLADAVDLMRKKTDFKSRSIETFAISFEGTNPGEAQKVVARMAEILVAENTKRAAEDTRGSSEFLEVEMKRVNEECDRIEREESEFLRQHPEFKHGTEGLGVEAQTKQAVEDESNKKKKPKGKGRGRPGASAPPGAPAAPSAGSTGAPAVDPVLITARTSAMQELLSAQKELADKSGRFTDVHPDVRSAKERVAAAQASLKRAEDAVAAAQPKEEAPPPTVVKIEDPYGDSTAKPAVSAAPSVDDDPDKDKEVVKPKKVDPDGEIKGVNLEMEWVRLERTLGLARARQTDMESKLYKAELFESTLESGYGSTLSVLDPAYKPGTPSNMPNQIVVLIGLGASVAVGLLFSATWGMFLDDRLFSPGEIEGMVQVPLLGAVPREPKKKVRNSKGKAGPDDAAAKSAAKGPIKRRWGFSRG